MTATQQFIKDALEGGWDPLYAITDNYTGFPQDIEPEFALLDPLVWQAVGKTRGWYITTKPCRHSDNYHGTCMRCAWHRFIDHLAEGKTIEEALELLR